MAGDPIVFPTMIQSPPGPQGMRGPAGLDAISEGYFYFCPNCGYMRIVPMHARWALQMCRVDGTTMTLFNPLEGK